MTTTRCPANSRGEVEAARREEGGMKELEPGLEDLGGYVHKLVRMHIILGC